MIGALYAQDHPGSIINATTGIFGALKPDIFDVFNHVYAEIKPFSFTGITSGYLQIAAYDRAYGGTPPNGLGYSREVTWPGPGLNFATVEGTPIFFFNVEGIIFYTDQTDDAEEIEENVDDESSAFKQMREMTDASESAGDELGEEIENIEAQAAGDVEDVALNASADIDADVAGAVSDGIIGGV